jgi:aspartyl-tRNA synthetase
MMRTHTCGELTKDNASQTVTLCGWVESSRDLGGVIFLVLRDRYGRTQVVLDTGDSGQAWSSAQSVHQEYVVRTTGVVVPRPPDMVNPNMPTGEIEVRSREIEILNRCERMPIPLDEESSARTSEDLRLEYRYLDLRRPLLQDRIRLRHRITQAIRNQLDALDFTEVETPILTKSTPEGARDFLVPSRLSPGAFYALPQAPQQYKQLLMVGGTDRYFQIARCFRDEDLRADRQPEFSQVDMELSFIEPEDIYAIIDALLDAVMQASGHGSIELPIPRMSYDEAIARFGRDAPDLRFGMELKDLSDILAATEFKVFANTIKQGGVVKAINAKGLAGLSARVTDEWTELAKEGGLGGLATVRVRKDGEWKSPIAKFLSDAEKRALSERLEIEPEDLILFAADEFQKVSTVLGRIRLLAGAEAGAIPSERYAFTWVVDFPLFERNEEGRLQSMHHPFTAPHDDAVARLDQDPESVYSKSYDIVLNGVELGGGSIRIHDPELQMKMFRVLGMPEDEAQARFGHLLRALGLGAPPHGGIALGLDRLVMMMAGGQSLRDVIAFPKTNKGVDMMMDAPAGVDQEQLQELAIATVVRAD